MAFQHVLARYVRRTQARASASSSDDRDHGVNGHRNGHAAGGLIEYVMERLVDGKGWVLRKRNGIGLLYRCKMDTFEPPTVDWVVAIGTEGAIEPPPFALNLNELARTRTPALALRTALTGVVPAHKPVPLVAAVEGAVPDDVNGWYVSTRIYSFPLFSHTAIVFCLLVHENFLASTLTHLLLSLLN